MSGVLVLVATPIGNLGDLSPRAIDALAGADVIACEDTRRTGRLLAHVGIKAPRLLVVNEHTEAERVSEVLMRLDRGDRVAVVTDAGTPGISDPGEQLVRAAVAAGHRVEVVPGPSAAVAALVASGLPTRRFCFEGFLPRKGSARTERVDALAAERRTLVLYEAPHRLARTLTDLAAALGPDRRVAIARELTKLHEEIWTGTLADARAWTDESPPRGEFVLVIDGAPEPRAPTDAEIDAAVTAELARGVSRRDAAAAVASRLGISKRRVYAAAVRRVGSGS
ncbi:MAG: 16S rRNA (cytidine(1402)-2'-O)-methyltransferase [Acidimicrobiales bacterium]